MIEFNNSDYVCKGLQNEKDPGKPINVASYFSFCSFKQLCACSLSEMQFNFKSKMAPGNKKCT